MSSLASTSKTSWRPLLTQKPAPRASAPPTLAFSRPLSSSSPGSGTSEKTGMPTIRPSTESITAHLNALLSPLSLSNIPDALAERLVTHRTAAGRLGNHNGRLAFYGRRVLHFHLALALHKQGHISQALLEQHLTPVELGRSGGVAAKLRLEQIMRWRPSLPSTVPMHNASQEDALGRGSGLWKLRGETLQSLQGAVWSHYGAEASEAFFTHHILDHLTLQTPSFIQTPVDPVSASPKTEETYCP